MESDVSVARPSSPSVDCRSQTAPKLPTVPASKNGRGRPRKKLRVLRQRKTRLKQVAPPARTETQAGPQDRYQLRQKRQPRYK